MKNLLWLLFYLPLLLYGQDEKKGIHFEKGLSWQQIKQKAKSANKYIFIDCYASWCGPCKKMDRDIYVTDSVGRFINGNFISVKIQADTTKYDNDEIKRWYADAHNLMDNYKVNAYPTFLFLSPDGKIVHKGLGFKNEEKFLALASEALDTSKQYYTLVEKYRKGEKDYSTMANLIPTASDFEDENLVNQIGLDYTSNYLDHLSDSLLFTKDNLRLLYQYTQGSKERGFTLFLRESRKIDSVMDYKGFSRALIDRVIYKEEVAPVLLRDTSSMNWDSITNNISKKYDASYSTRIVSRSKISWYKNKNDIKNYIKWIIISVADYSPVEDMNNWLYINYYSWEIFKNSTKTGELNTAAKWMKRMIENKSHPENINSYTLDTYANLLYKMGKKSEAIKYENRAAAIDPKEILYKKTLMKMKSGKPILVSK